VESETSKSCGGVCSSAPLSTARALVNSPLMDALRSTVQTLPARGLLHAYDFTWEGHHFDLCLLTFVHTCLFIQKTTFLFILMYSNFTFTLTVPTCSFIHRLRIFLFYCQFVFLIRL
jgi:hypothetical protein